MRSNLRNPVSSRKSGNKKLFGPKTNQGEKRPRDRVRSRKVSIVTHDQ